jgi:HSP20 family molecular chaperone IbpA
MATFIDKIRNLDEENRRVSMVNMGKKESAPDKPTAAEEVLPTGFSMVKADLDLWENGILITLDLAGAAENEIEVKTDKNGDVLIIQGKRENISAVYSQLAKDASLINFKEKAVAENKFLPFYRRFTFPRKIDFAQKKMKFSSGILMLAFPFKQEERIVSGPESGGAVKIRRLIEKMSEEEDAELKILSSELKEKEWRGYLGELKTASRKMVSLAYVLGNFLKNLAQSIPFLLMRIVLGVFNKIKNKFNKSNNGK